MAKSYYMHTLNDQPAAFYGGLICFMSLTGSPNRLAASLVQIRREQQASIRYERIVGQEREGDDFKYGYLRVCLPPQESTT